MKIRWKRTLSTLLAIAMMASLPMGPAAAEEADSAGHTLWLVGDSTVCGFADTYYYPRYGYGTQIGGYLDGTYKVENLALSGRSSRDFLTYENYETLMNGMKAGDALIIGFGHNDEKEDADRYTDPNGTYETEGSFARSLYENYVKPAQEAGVEVILCTPIARRTTETAFSDSQLHKTAGSDGYPGGDYPAAIRKLGEDKSVPVVDLTELTRALYLDLGPDETLYLHAWTSGKESSVDNTHLNIYGAKLVAYLLAEALKESGTELGGHVADLSDKKPDKAKDLVTNPDYDEPDYDPSLARSEYWQDYVCDNPAGEGDMKELTFKGTIFGDLSGNLDPSSFTLEPRDGKAHIAVRNDKGKIAGSSDGIAMYYLRLPAGTQFKFTAKATLNDIAAHNQVAFGLMARDDMYIDTYDKNILSDYVAAATLGGANECNSFYRLNGTLGGQAKLTKTTIEAGQTYELSIVSNSDGYACTFGDEPPQTGGYDFQLTSVDSDYFYIGMFAVRNVDVTFSDISLEISYMPEDAAAPGAGRDGVKAETAKAPDGGVTITATAGDGEVIARVEIPAVIPALDYRFEDVPEGHWAEAAINAMAALGVVKGVSEKRHVFDINADITRGAMAQILFNLSNGKAGKAESFSDVAEGGVFTGAIGWATGAGVVTGYSDSVFGPGDSITREQLAVMLCRYAKLLGLDTAVGGTALTGYPDAGSVSTWAADAMAWAVSNGLIQGKDGNHLDPSASASRAETAVVLRRFLELLK